jgi:hypothetical protein
MFTDGLWGRGQLRKTVVFVYAPDRTTGTPVGISPTSAAASCGMDSYAGFEQLAADHHPPGCGAARRKFYRLHKRALAPVTQRAVGADYACLSRGDVRAGERQRVRLQQSRPWSKRCQSSPWLELKLARVCLAAAARLLERSATR